MGNKKILKLKQNKFHFIFCFLSKYPGFNNRRGLVVPYKQQGEETAGIPDGRALIDLTGLFLFHIIP